MGSGTSKTNDTKKPPDDVKQQEKSLPGSSVPPKGPPPLKRSVPINDTGNGTTSAKSTINRPKVQTERIEKNEKQVNGKAANSDYTPAENSSNTTKPVLSREETNLLKKSAYMRRNDTKNLYRKMEMGMEDEDDVDNILGLDRMKTRIQLKREKTRLKRADRKSSKPMVKFQQAAMKVKSSGLKVERPRTTQDELYMGNVSIECPSTAKVVRIFTSSTFTDTMHERNKLMEKAYPRIKAYCRDLGYDFQVVDMRWGIRDEATDNQMGTEICIRELKTCQKLSTGPNFISMMSNKYGYTDFPRCIDAAEYETILKQVDDKEIAKLFDKWYNKDTNADPPVYVVYSISHHIPDFLSDIKEKKDAAKKQWYKESEAIQATLEEVAQKVFDAQTARKYIRSITETEVFEGLLSSSDPPKQCLWLKRTIDGIENQESSFLVSRYIECTFNNSEEKVKKVREMLAQLKEQMTKKLKGNILDYTVSWDKEKGLDPKTNEYANYLSKMNDDFVAKMCSMIYSAVQEKNTSGEPVLNEIIQHTQFCQTKCLHFHGREDILKQIKFYLKGMSSEPLVLHGASGSGKTSITAMAAMKCAEWTENKAAVILRFIGTTPDSSNLVGLLTSITSQIRRAYNLDMDVSKDLRTLIDEFHLSMFLASADRPLVIILDSLDMIDTSYNARQLHWLPSKLRNYVKMIVSTLPDDQFEAYPVLKTTVHTQENFVKVPSLTDTDLGDIIDKWLKMKHRKLTQAQKKIVTTMCAKCPLPLYLKLAFDKAVTWTSFVSSSSTALEPTIRQSIDSLFERLERMHGQIFVSRALGYLTLAKNGLTETELEDIMSCDDDVLNDVYLYWTPPIRRLPPLLLVRLRADLDQYLVDRGADGVQVMYWYHRQFIEAAQNRYCADQTLNTKLHSALADFFAGKWSNGQAKPFISAKGEKGNADRHVAAQPNKFGSSYNLRKLNNLPYHRCSAMQPDMLKSESLCNFEFLLDKLKATTLWMVMDDFTMAKGQFPNDELITGLENVLHLAQVGLLYDPRQLVSQFLGRLPKTKSTDQFLKECEQFPVPSLLPDKRILTQPGGQLLHSMAGHKGDILSLDLTQDNTTALTCSDDNSIRLWNIATGQQILYLDGLGKLSRARFCYHDNSILIDINKKLSVRARSSGEKVFDISTVTDDSPSCLCGEDKTMLAVFKENSAFVYDLKDGSQQTCIQLSNEVEFKFPGFAVGSKNYAVVTTSDQVYLTVLDLKKNEFSSLFRGFEPSIDNGINYFKEIGEEIQYEIDEIAISRDEKHIIYSNIYTNDIVFLDFRAKKKTNVVRGDPNDFMRSLKCSSDGKSMYFVKGPYVCFHDIKTAKATEELEHTVDVISACTNDMKTVVTTAEDSSVRVWDRTKQVQKMSQTSDVNPHRIRMIRTLNNARYIVGFGFKTKENDSQILFVYDVFKHCVVREKSLDCSILHMEVLNDTELLIVHDVIQKLKVVNIDTLHVTREFQGYLQNTKWTFEVIPKRNEIACMSFGRHNMKVYNSQTGKVAAVLETKHQKQLDGFCVSLDGTVLVAWCEDTSDLFVFELTQRKLIRKITSEETAMFDEDQVKLTENSKYLLHKVEGVPAKSRRDEDEVYIKVLDVHKGTKVADLVDIEYHNRYHAEKERSGISSSVDTFEVLDNTTVLSAHDDYILRIFNLTTGELLRRLHGHSTCVEILYNTESPYIVTFGSWTEEMSLRVWDKVDYSCVTSYTLDKMITNLDFSSDKKFILATLGKPAEVVTWRFNHFKHDLNVNVTDYPESLKGQDIKGYLDLVPEEDGLIVDPNDPDKDVPDDSSDDDDDFV